MNFRIKWKELLLVLFLILAPPMVSLHISGCTTEIPIWEIYDQELTVLKEGKYSEIGIRIRYVAKVAEYVSVENIDDSDFSLLATSPAPPQIKNKISSISVISDQDFDSTAPSGVNLISYFEVTQSTPVSVTYPIGIDEQWSVYLQLKQAPAIDHNARLTITSTTDDGKTISDQTTFITILK